VHATLRPASHHDLFLWLSHCKFAHFLLLAPLPGIILLFQFLHAICDWIMKHWEWLYARSWRLNCVNFTGASKMHQSTRSTVQMQSRSSATASLCERSDLAFIIESWISFYFFYEPQDGKCPDGLTLVTVARRASRYLGRHCDRHQHCIIFEQKRVIRWLISRSRDHAEKYSDISK
jgi:hypothetical protein